MSNISNIIKKAKSIFSDAKMFGHHANGELCPVCQKPMYTKQEITMVMKGGGTKMHSNCWAEFFQKTIENMKTNCH